LPLQWLDELHFHHPPMNVSFGQEFEPYCVQQNAVKPSVLQVEVEQLQLPQVQP